MHATIIGVAAPANPPPAEPKNAAADSDKNAADLDVKKGNEPTTLEPLQSAPQPANVVPTARRGLSKRTMIGGLEAAPGSAPIPQAVGLGIPSEVKWTVLLADSGAAVLSAADIVRAYAEGRIKADAKLWREGLDGWRTLAEIEPIRLAFQRAGLSLERPGEERAAKDAPPPSAPAATGPSGKRAAEIASNPLAAIPPSSARAAAPTERFEPSWDEERATLSKEITKEDDVTRVAPTPWFAAEPETVDGTKGGPSTGSTATLDDDRDPVHPANRPDIGPRDTVRGQLSPVASTPPEQLKVTAGPTPENAGAPMARTPERTFGGGASPSPASEKLTARVTGPSKGGASLAPTVRSPNAALLSPNLETGPQELRSKTMVRPRIRGRSRHSRRWLSVVVWSSLFVALIASLVLSYRYRQPKALYDYLRKQQWEAPLDRHVQRFIVRPYRQLVPPPAPAKRQH